MPSKFTTGIRIDGNRIEWSTLFRNKGAIEVEETQRTELAVDPEAIEAGDTAYITGLKRALKGVKGAIGSCLPADQTLFRVVDLPSVDPDELQGMVDLQVDKISPFPMEHAALSYEILSQQEATTRVLIAVTRKTHVDQLGEFYRKAGILLSRIDVDILGWWRLVTDEEPPPEKGRHVTLIFSPVGGGMIVTHNGSPLVIRSISAIEAVTPERISEFCEDISYAMTTLEAEWGGAEHVGLSIWVEDEAPPGLLSQLHSSCGLSGQVSRLNELPPLTEGLARRALDLGHGELDLAPDQWLDEARLRRGRRGIIIASGIFLVIWLVAVVVLFAGYGMQMKRVERLREQSEELEASAAWIRQIKEKAASLERYADRSRSSLECLREVSRLMPQGVELTAFSYKKGKDVTLRGEAGQEAPIYDFIEVLESSDMFTGVQADNISSKKVRDKLVTEFNVTVTLPGDAS